MNFDDFIIDPLKSEESNATQNTKTSLDKEKLIQCIKAKYENVNVIGQIKNMGDNCIKVGDHYLMWGYSEAASAGFTDNIDKFLELNSRESKEKTEEADVIYAQITWRENKKYILYTTADCYKELKDEYEIINSKIKNLNLSNVNDKRILRIQKSGNLDKEEYLYDILVNLLQWGGEKHGNI